MGLGMGFGCWSDDGVMYWLVMGFGCWSDDGGYVLC